MGISEQLKLSFPFSGKLFKFAKEFFFFFGPCHATYVILVPRQGIELGPLAGKARSPNH